MEHDLAEAALFRFKRPVDGHPGSVRSGDEAHGSHFPAIQEESSTLHSRGGGALHRDRRSAQGGNAAFERTFLPGLIGVFREVDYNLHLLDSWQGRHRDVVSIAPGFCDLCKVVKTVLGCGQAILKPADTVFHPGPPEGFGERLLPLTFHDEGKLLRLGIGVFDDDLYLVSFQDLNVLGLNGEAYRSGISKIAEGRNRPDQETLGLPGINHEDQDEDGRQPGRRPEPALGSAGPHLDGGIHFPDIPLCLQHEFLEKPFRDSSPGIARQFQGGADPLLDFRVPGLQPSRDLHQGDAIPEGLYKPGPDRPERPHHDGSQQDPAHHHRHQTKDPVSGHGEEEPPQHDSCHRGQTSENLHAAHPSQEGLQGLDNLPGKFLTHRMVVVEGLKADAGHVRISGRSNILRKSTPSSNNPF